MKNTDRLEAFSDGVLAIIITIMVLKLDVPNSSDIGSLYSVLPVFLSYILSFIYVGIYWNNHHHMFQITQKISGGILWANLNLLFWLSLLPFATAWIGQNTDAAIPTAIYGLVLLLAALAWWILKQINISTHAKDSLIHQAMSDSYKEIISPILYIAGIVLAFIQPWISEVIYAVVALIWIIPDRRVENAIKKEQAEH